MIIGKRKITTRPDDRKMKLVIGIYCVIHSLRPFASRIYFFLMGFREAGYPACPENHLSTYKSLKHEKATINIIFYQSA
jgi:hypothetical protein